MNIREYQAAAMRFLNNDLPESTKLIHGALGMANESGEVLGLIKKHLIYGRPLVLADLCKEVGDVMWYAARHATAYRFTLLDPYPSHLVAGSAEQPLAYASRMHKAAAEILDEAEAVFPEEMDGDRGEARCNLVVLWAAKLLQQHGTTLEVALEINIEKLSKRYPSGRFIASDAIAKADER